MLAAGVHLDSRRRAACLDALTLDDWLAVIGHAKEHGLGPALGASLADMPGCDAVPVDIVDYLRLLHRANGDRCRAVRRQVLELVAALNGRGIEPLLLKGALTLFADPGCDPGVRLMAGIDFAVPQQRRRAAEDTLAALGYRIASRYPKGHHAVGGFKRDGAPAAVGLHLELIDQPYVLRAAGVAGRASAVRLENGATLLMPDVTDRILHVLLHAQIHHLGQYYRWQIVLGQLYDFATIVAAHGRRADWDAIDTLLDRHRLRPVLDSYLLAAGELLGLDWPLDRVPAARARLHMRACLLQLFHPDLQQITAPVGNLRAAFAWHRMQAIYGESGGPLSWIGRHAWQYLKHHDARQAMTRLFR